MCTKSNAVLKRCWDEEMREAKTVYVRPPETEGQPFSVISFIPESPGQFLTIIKGEYHEECSSCGFQPLFIESEREKRPEWATLEQLREIKEVAREKFQRWLLNRGVDVENGSVSLGYQPPMSDLWLEQKREEKYPLLGSRQGWQSVKEWDKWEALANETENGVRKHHVEDVIMWRIIRSPQCEDISGEKQPEKVQSIRSNPPKRKKRVVLNEAKIMEIISFVGKHPGMSNKEIAKHFDLGESTISHNKKLQEGIKRAKGVNMSEIRKSER